MEDRRKTKVVYFDEDRFWYIRKAKVLTIGLSQTGLEELGDLSSISLPEEGTEIDKSDELVEIEGADGALNLEAPAGGVVIEVNTLLERSVKPLQEDPDGEGWILRIECSDPAELKEYE